jgi:hypothetical protein
MGVPQRKSDEDGVGYLISVPRGLDLALDFEEVSGIFVYVNGYNGYHDFTGDFGLPGALRKMRAEDFRRHWGEPKGVRPADIKLGGIVFENSAERFEVGDLSIMCEFDRQGILRMIANFVQNSVGQIGITEHGEA